MGELNRLKLSAERPASGGENMNILQRSEVNLNVLWRNQGLCRVPETQHVLLEEIRFNFILAAGYST